jgi:HPt (histidine-containing phosphotransfer) domain-containing protein
VKKLRFLLVDADPKRLERAASMLASADHSVLSVSSPEEAEEALEIVKVDAVVFGSPEPEPVSFVRRLREFERGQKHAFRAPVLALSQEVSDPPGWSPAGPGVIDGYLAEGFGPEALVRVFEFVGRASASQNNSAEPVADAPLPVFEPEKFQQQVAYDPALAAEIIDLFLEEKSIEVPEMQRALEKGDFRQLSEVAHTIKGSLSSLHAMLARHHAQELETAAKAKDSDSCGRILSQLASDLDTLEPLLLNLRDQAEPK